MSDSLPPTPQELRDKLRYIIGRSSLEQCAAHFLYSEEEDFDKTVSRFVDELIDAILDVFPTEQEKYDQSNESWKHGFMNGKKAANAELIELLVSTRTQRLKEYEVTKGMGDYYNGTKDGRKAEMDALEAADQILIDQLRGKTND